MCDDGNNIIVVDSTSRDMPSGVYVDVKYGPNIIPVDATVITKSIDDTNSIFEKQIATLKEVFGDNNVTVEWGVVTYTT
jgi:acyl-homoserine lactone acylase PvdQ